MKYVDWVELVARTYADLRPDNNRMQGLAEVARVLGHPDGSDEVWTAIQDLGDLGIVEIDSIHWVKPTQATRAVRQGASLRELWPGIVERFLDPEQEELLGALVGLAEGRHTDHADVEWVEISDLYKKLSWQAAEHEPYALVGSLEELGLVRARKFGGGAISLYPTYRGVVRATEKVTTEWQKRLRAMVAEWETTTVEFKRELPLGTVGRNAKFARNVTALANTKASGEERHLVLGYNPKTHEFEHSADPTVTQDRLEQVLNAYASPALDIRYITVEIEPGSHVGLVEVSRVPAKLPYRVVKGGGKIAADTIWVRHGSQVEPPSQAELRALEAEGQRARES